MMRLLMSAILGFSAMLGTAAAQTSQPVTSEEWSSYKSRFVEASGRVRDDANDNISHSEGQGYGLLLAYLAGSEADFDQIWAFTRTNLLLRDDGLAAWKWQADATPNVTDINNASDGDILIAYALSLGAKEWGRGDLRKAAAMIAQSLADTSIHEEDDYTLLRPGVAGFDRGDQPDGPIVNMSYWIFEAFDELAELAPQGDWRQLETTGLRLAESVSFGSHQLPPDWLSLAAQPAIAQGFPSDFGYNAIRIPLYLIRSGYSDETVLRRFRTGMSDGSAVRLVDLQNGAVTDRLTDAGYRIIPALIDCVVDETPLPSDLKQFVPTMYYPSTLHLLTLAYMREERSTCL